MVASKSVFVVVLTSIFCFGRTSIDWPAELCVLNNGIDRNQGRPDPLQLLPREMRRSINGSKFNYPCQFKTCLSICCSNEEAQYNGNCIKDNAISDAMPQIRIAMDNGEEREVSKQNFHLLFRNPCAFDWMLGWRLENFTVLENGSIRGTDKEEESFWDLQHYCLFREPETVVYFAKVCRPWLKATEPEIVSGLCVTFIMLAIFIVYTVVPELRNFHGMLFRSYIATYIVMATSILGALLTNESKTYTSWYTCSENMGLACAGSCVLWLNVMSFNIWRTIRSVRIVHCTTREHKIKKFVWYAVYAWGTPAGVTTIMAVIIKYFLDRMWRHTLQIWISVCGFLTIYICNAFFYTLTTLRIRRHRKDTAHLTNGVNKHYDIDHYWHKLYAKLFLIMGGHTLAWSVWLIWPTFVISHILAVLEFIQASLTFYIFVWKDNIKHALHELFVTTLKRLRSTSSYTERESLT